MVSRGFLLGIAWGCAVAALGVVTVSVLATPPGQGMAADSTAAMDPQTGAGPVAVPVAMPDLPKADTAMKAQDGAGSDAVTGLPNPEPDPDPATVMAGAEDGQTGDAAAKVLAVTDAFAPTAEDAATAASGAETAPPALVAQITAPKPALPPGLSQDAALPVMPSAEAGRKAGMPPQRAMEEMELAEAVLPSVDASIAPPPKPIEVAGLTEPASDAAQNGVPMLKVPAEAIDAAKPGEAAALPAAVAPDAAPGQVDLPPVPPLPDAQNTPEGAAGDVIIAEAAAPENSGVMPDAGAAAAELPAATPETAPATVTEKKPASTLEFAPKLTPAPGLVTAAGKLPGKVAATVLQPGGATPGFGKSVDGVVVGGLPHIGDDKQPAGQQAAAPAPDAGDDLPPLQRFAREFENPSDKPLFAILLQDPGGPHIDRESLANLPFPVSFVIDPTLPDAQTAAAIYRAAGQEVVMLAAGLPEGANAADLAVNFEAYAKALPEAVAVADIETGGFQGDRALASQVLTVVDDQGRGVISWEKGLNSASQIARREGIANTTIFRRLDGEDEKSPLIRRYLDRAAFKAAQDGRVTVLGEARPETVAALLEWAVEGRAATVALAPVTAIMQRQ